MNKLFVILSALLLAMPAWAANNNFSSYEECNTAVGKKEFSLYTPSILRGAGKARAEAMKYGWKEGPLSEGISPVCVDMPVSVPNVVRRWAPMAPQTRVWRDREGKVRAIVDCGNVIYDARQTAPIFSAAPPVVVATITCNLSDGRVTQVARREDCRETVTTAPAPVVSPAVRRVIVYDDAPPQYAPEYYVPSPVFVEVPLFVGGGFGYARHGHAHHQQRGFVPRTPVGVVPGSRTLRLGPGSRTF
ncbi:MAG: hypothetical protein A2648_00735 [Candidatus Lloydbacteria bacterium RIFCSPHIGHO2_01_FULL_41_20]|uniref:Uncharacterized protein n=1 Tax=Candidatus Lloydbacteria bacterium RIFCSPHIGHO2_01_FULL_41_20 TaxID=1798657 RepID=A0A1G2CTS6_9BACT|nr:MAG: hypothetical protein A2648_00735 [Candidatus Lloydbacteria bacterium RIFCSPHIGHO2_01_FULL_41_20]